MSNKVTGVIHSIGETVTFESGFSKRPVVITFQDGDYENHLSVEFLKDKTSVLDNYAVGQPVIVHYNLRSNENPNKPGQWFTNANGWKIEADGPAPPAPNVSSTEVVGDEIPFSPRPNTI